ncbi:hypothetical protein OS493_032156 [Desmophyllum pertusum]|uniref:Uncharacterized protein n=1 Tax=Desmophyllum pertusum TaxID=174260 RepID=A0A9W9Y897_9CNID|nr:hypothetical protein OS493_032156 [Desmophyllum pertusum]
MSGIQSLNNLVSSLEVCECGRLMMLALVNVLRQKQVKGFGTPQGPTELCIVQPFSVPQMRRLVLLDPPLREVCPNNLSLGHHSLSKKSHKLLKLRGCISPALRRDIQRHTSLFQVYRNTWTWAIHLVRLERETTYDTIKKKWAETCKEVSGSYLQKETGSSSQTAVTDPTCEVSKEWPTSHRPGRSESFQDEEEDFVAEAEEMSTRLQIRSQLEL